jgi:hypothetical protein
MTFDRSAERPTSRHRREVRRSTMERRENTRVRNVPNELARCCAVLRDPAHRWKTGAREFNVFRYLWADPARFELTTSAFGGQRSSSLYHYGTPLPQRHRSSIGLLRPAEDGECFCNLPLELPSFAGKRRTKLLSLPAHWRPRSGTRLLDGRRHPARSFPLDLLPQPWRDWALDAARFSGAPVDYVMQTMLASVVSVSLPGA